MSKSGSAQLPIQHIAKLANLQLTDEQLKKFEQNLSSILDYMQEITKIDLSNVPATARVIDEENILREDEVESSLSQAEVLKNAPASHDGYFVVNAIFEDKGA